MKTIIEYFIYILIGVIWCLLIGADSQGFIGYLLGVILYNILLIGNKE